MQTLIKTHKMNRTYHGNHFFVLSKGNNAGRPMDKPCPNCFVVISKMSTGETITFLAVFWTLAMRVFSTSPLWLCDSVSQASRIEINYS